MAQQAVIERPAEPEAAQQVVIARPTEPEVAQQSVIAVSDLSVFGTNFPDGYIFTRKEIEDYRREFNSKLVNNIKISNAQRTKRFTPACYCIIVVPLNSF